VAAIREEACAHYVLPARLAGVKRSVQLTTAEVYLGGFYTEAG
jgi:hypothetical protein